MRATTMDSRPQNRRRRLQRTDFRASRRHDERFLPEHLQPDRNAVVDLAARNRGFLELNGASPGFKRYTI